MRCLNCDTDGIAASVQICPNCNAHIPTLLRETLPSGTLLHGGSYRIDYPIGSGGFGIIYRAVHTVLEHPIAMKEFYPRELVVPRVGATSPYISTWQKKEFDIELQQFLHEGRIIADINHPGVVRVRDLFEENGTAYLVMDMVRGRTLRKELENHPHRLPSKQVDKILGQLVAALETLHQAGIYHLDIKPENILLTPTGEVVLVDFGAAKQKSCSYSKYQFDHSYAAPEVMSGRFGPKSDLFELGMLAHELLTGERPPSAEKRREGTPLRMTLQDSSWYKPVTQALQLQEEKRPASVQTWWKEGRSSRQIISRRGLLKDTLIITTALVTGGGGTILFEMLQPPPLGVPLYIYRNHRGSIDTVAWSLDGKFIASAGEDHLIAIWDAPSGHTMFTCKGHTEVIYTVVWSPKSDRLASAGKDRMIKIWHLPSGRALFTYKGHKNTIYTVAWSANGNHIASGGADRVVNIWNPASGHTYLIYKGHTGIVHTVAWSPDGNQIASGGEDHVVRIWNSTSGHTLFTCKGHTSNVYTAAWSPDGKYIASGSADKTVKIWDALSTNLLLTYSGHTDRIEGIAWSPDSKFIVSSSADKTVQVWRASH